jgi:hypothetical protein
MAEGLQKFRIIKKPFRVDGMEDYVQNLTDRPKWSLWVFKIDIKMSGKRSNSNRKTKICNSVTPPDKKAKD